MSTWLLAQTEQSILSFVVLPICCPSSCLYLVAVSHQFPDRDRHNRVNTTTNHLPVDGDFFVLRRDFVGDFYFFVVTHP